MKVEHPAKWKSACNFPLFRVQTQKKYSFPELRVLVVAMETLNTQDLLREHNTCAHLTCIF